MKQSERERIDQLIRDEYPTGDLYVLAKKCGYSAAALRQRASVLKGANGVRGVKRDKKVYGANISASLKRAHAESRNLKECSSPKKPKDIVELFKDQAILLTSNGYQSLANIPEFIAIECQNVKQLSKLPYLKRHVQKM